MTMKRWKWSRNKNGQWIGGSKGLEDDKVLGIGWNWKAVCAVERKEK
jgi:hypothetical protein